ncbi:MAG TPA: 50S ribosomal protein L15 [Candidatus Binatia bacterium]
MDLSNLHPAPGARKPRRRVGRGPGSGLGKTAGRGHKGHKSRSGGNTPPGYEGGQMPLQRRLPKRGFRNPFRKEYDVVNLSDLGRFQAGTVVDLEALAKAGLTGKVGRRRVKILGDGTLEHALTVKAHAFSASAKAAIEAKGGTAEVLA